MFDCFLIGDMFLIKNPNDAGLASLRVLRNSRWRPRWPPFQHYLLCDAITLFKPLFNILFTLRNNAVIMDNYLEVNLFK